MYERNTQYSLRPTAKDCSVSDKPCPYIPNAKMSVNHRQVDIVTQSFASRVTQRGWRRFGRNYIYPECGDCTECKSLRIDVAGFKHSKSQKKAINRNDDTNITIREPSSTQEHVDLYNKYHAYKSQKDGWTHKEISRTEYYETYVSGAFEFGKELRYYIDDKLVCVDLIDILDDGISAVYCYYDPDYPRFSLGTYSLLYQIHLAKTLGLKWVYLGNWIEGYKAFEYKEKFQPLEVLDGFPKIVEQPLWKPWMKNL